MGDSYQRGLVEECSKQQDIGVVETALPALVWWNWVELSWVDGMTSCVIRSTGKPKA
jgi:hypothetical protein